MTQYEFPSLHVILFGEGQRRNIYYKINSDDTNIYLFHIVFIIYPKFIEVDS